MFMFDCTEDEKAPQTSKMSCGEIIKPSGNYQFTPM